MPGTGHPNHHRTQEHLFTSSRTTYNTQASPRRDPRSNPPSPGLPELHTQPNTPKLPRPRPHLPTTTTLSRAHPPPLPAANMLGLANMQPRQLATQLLNFALVLSTAFMLWKGLSVVSDSPSPIVVVLSGSMEPAFERGDLLFLWNRGADTQVGEIVVYNVKGKDIPIVHRVVRRFGGG